MKKKSNQLVIYQTRSGSIELKSDIKAETIWASLDQIAAVFGRDKSVISRHINNILETGELGKRATVAKIATVQTEGGREISRKIEYFNLDMILSVGYRVNSVQATLFRKWATKILREYIVEGYTVNKSRIAKNCQQFLKTVEEIKFLSPSSELIHTGDVIELIGLYADTWVSLEAYDKGELKTKQITKKSVDFTAQKLEKELANLKSELLSKSQATQIFGVEQNPGTLTGIVGNIMQSFGGKDLYPSIEEKSAHLLYFMVKDHPFMDGNKRSAAFAFIWVLKQAGILNTNKLTPPALTALTILIAESNSKDKERVIKLISSLF
ncbi:MAG: virulence protein RhuM/Fic/DOC family protein [Patescibacteria group bacterium]